MPRSASWPRPAAAPPTSISLTQPPPTIMLAFRLEARQVPLPFALTESRFTEIALELRTVQPAPRARSATTSIAIVELQTAQPLHRSNWLANPSAQAGNGLSGFSPSCPPSRSHSLQEFLMLRSLAPFR